MHNCRTLLFHCSSVPNMTFFSNPCIYWIGEYSNIQEWHHFAAWVPFRPREPQTYMLHSAVWNGVLDAFLFLHFCILQFFRKSLRKKSENFLWILYALFRCSSAFETKGTTDFYLYRKDSAVWHGVLDVFIFAFLWVLLKLIVRAFRPRDHDRAADDLSLPLCAKPSTSSYNHCPIVFVFRIVISSFLCYGQYLCFMILDPSRKYN